MVVGTKFYMDPKQNWSLSYLCLRTFTDSTSFFKQKCPGISVLVSRGVFRCPLRGPAQYSFLLAPFTPVLQHDTNGVLSVPCRPTHPHPNRPNLLKPPETVIPDGDQQLMDRDLVNPVSLQPGLSLSGHLLHHFHTRDVTDETFTFHSNVTKKWNRKFKYISNRRRIESMS